MPARMTWYRPGLDDSLVSAHVVEAKASRDSAGIREDVIFGDSHGERNRL